MINKSYTSKNNNIYYIFSYLEMHREWFGEQFYMQAENRAISQMNNV